MFKFCSETNAQNNTPYILGLYTKIGLFTLKNNREINF